MHLPIGQQDITGADAVPRFRWLTIGMCLLHNSVTFRYYGADAPRGISAKKTEPRKLLCMKNPGVTAVAAKYAELLADVRRLRFEQRTPEFSLEHVKVTRRLLEPEHAAPLSPRLMTPTARKRLADASG